MRLRRRKPRPIGVVQYIDFHEDHLVVGRPLDRGEEIRLRCREIPEGQIVHRADASVMAGILARAYATPHRPPAWRWLCALLGHWPVETEDMMRNTSRCACGASVVATQKAFDIGHPRWTRFVHRTLWLTRSVR